MDQLKSDMLELIELSEKIGKYEQMLLQHSNIEDKLNYDSKKCSIIKEKINILQERFYFLKEKWF